MRVRNRRRLALVALLLGVVALVRFWPDESSRDDGASQPPAADAARQETAGAPRSATASGRTSTVADSVGTAGDSRAAASAIGAPPRPARPPIELQVDAPSDVRVGEVFEARIYVEAYGGLSQLMFAVSYEKTRLTLVDWSEGSFAQQGALPIELGAEEPSDGNIQVIFQVDRGMSAAGAGSVAVFQFEAVQAGSSGITLQNLAAVDGKGVAYPVVSVLHEGAVTIY